MEDKNDCAHMLTLQKDRGRDFILLKVQCVKCSQCFLFFFNAAQVATSKQNPHSLKLNPSDFGCADKNVSLP